MIVTETATTVEERVIGVIAERLALIPGTIRRADGLVDDYSADHLDMANVILGIEEEFNIDIPDKDAKKIRTVEGIISYIERAIRAGQIKERKK